MPSSRLDLESRLVDAFYQQVETRGFKKKRALQGVVELWLSLPVGLQAQILAGECGPDVLDGAVRYILRNQMDNLREKFGDLRAESNARTQESNQ
jgi:hypothetical protein